MVVKMQEVYFNPNDKKSKYRFLTPRECFILMGFDEKDYEVLSDFGDAIRVNIYRPSYIGPISEPINEPINESINQKLSKNAQVVFAKIIENLDANRDGLAVLCGLSLATIKRALKELKEKGYISGKTSNKSGQWIVNKDIKINANMNFEDNK